MRHTLAPIALVLAMLASPRARAETCVTCHTQRSEARLRAPVAAVIGDVHGTHEVRCSGCHGGNPEDPTARAHDLGRGFIGRPDRVGTAQLCGRCHDGSTDAPAVLDAYRSSRHGRVVGEGHFAATCTSCHGAHGVTDPSAPGSRARLIGTCGTCHSDAERMEASGLPTDQAQQWADSVHGHAVSAGNEEAPVCATCHDAHDAEAGLHAVSACGRCHSEIRAAFDRGPHRARFARLGFLDCAECHGSHEIEPASAALLTGVEAACTHCHGRGQGMFDEIVRIAALAPRLDAARAQLRRDDPQRVEIVGHVHALDVEALERSLEGFEPLPPATEEPGRSAVFAGDRRWLGFTFAIVLVLLGLAVLWLVQRLRRRS